MSATYTMQEMKDLHNEEETLLYPRMIIKGQCSTEDLVNDIAKQSSYSAGEIKGMLVALHEAMTREMARGYSVKLDQIGTFTPSLGLAKGKEAELPEGDTRRNARSIRHILTIGRKQHGCIGRPRACARTVPVAGGRPQPPERVSPPNVR